MVSPVPKHLTTEREHEAVPKPLREHVADLAVDPSHGVGFKGSGTHRAKFAPGLATALLQLAGTTSVGDPMAGTGTLARETGVAAALNDLDGGMARFLDDLAHRGCEVTYGPAHEVPWSRRPCDPALSGADAAGLSAHALGVRAHDRGHQELDPARRRDALGP